jgi:hypothetical protein
MGRRLWSMQLKNDLLVAYRGYYVDLAFKEKFGTSQF